MPIENRKISKEEYGKVIQFLQAVVPRFGFSEEWFQWKYENNPAGPPHIYFAEDTENNILVGIYCIIAWDLAYQGSIVHCAQSVDTMIHPDYRGRGIVETLSQFMFEDLKSTHVSNLFGFPNEKFFPITLKIGWKHLGNMRSYVKPLSLKMISRKGKRFVPIFLLRIIDNVLKSLDEIRVFLFCHDHEMQEVYDFKGYDAQEARTGDSIGTSRSHRYLTWRFIDKSGADYRIHCLKRGQKNICWIVSRDTENDTTVLDIITIHDSAVIPALLLLSNAMLKEGRQFIRISCHGPISKKLTKAGFICREKGLPIIYFNIDKDSPIISQSSHWSIMLGDLDAA